MTYRYRRLKALPFFVFEYKDQGVGGSNPLTPTNISIKWLLHLASIGIGRGLVREAFLSVHWLIVTKATCPHPM